METTRTCFLHVGTHKTATTSIQAFLFLNRERFASLGTYFPAAGSDRWPGQISHHQLAYDLTGDPRYEPEHGGLERVAAELSTCQARTACVTSEQLCLLWNDRTALGRLRSAIVSAGFQPRVVIYLRPQASYCSAVYAEAVKDGYHVAFRDYIRDILRTGHYWWDGGMGPPFDYERLVAPFAAVFGHNAIIVRRYRSTATDRAILDEFARLLVPPNTDLQPFAVPKVRENGSRDFESVLRLLGVPYRGSERIRFTPLTWLDTVRIFMRFSGSNREISRRYGVVLPAVEPRDVGFALPLRTTWAKTRSVVAARRALARAESAPQPAPQSSAVSSRQPLSTTKP